VFDEPVENIVELRERLIGRYPILREPLDDELALVVVNGETIFSGESEHAVKSGDSIEFVHAISGG
jgi:molybdopterin converting factor small subunit